MSDGRMSMKMEFDSRALKGHLERMPPKVHDALKNAITRETLTLLKLVKDTYLTGRALHVRTGLLRRSGTFRVLDYGAKIMGIVGVNTPYAAIHEYGGQTKAHEIRPKNARVLAFFGNGYAYLPQRAGVKTQTGKWSSTSTTADRQGLTYRMVVNHPGSKIPARPYMKPALADRSSAIVQALRAAVDKGMK